MPLFQSPPTLQKVQADVHWQIMFLYIARGSLTELEYYIHLAKRLDYLSDADYQRLNTLQDETARVLWGFIRFKEQEAEASCS